MQLEATLKKTVTSKHWVNVVLSLVGIGIPLLSGLCEGSCSFLTGSIFSVDLKYFGILYMGLLLLFSLLRKSFLNLFLLSVGMGAEIQLVAFQIKNSTYCPSCIAFGTVIVILFLLNFDRSKKIFITTFLILGFILFSLFFQGTVTPLYAENPPKKDLLSSFGTSKTQIRIYSDYFCVYCRSLEPELEKVIPDLVKKGIVSITFIDTPIHKYSSLYATYFLYILNEKKEFNYVLRARAILFEAAKNNITQKEKLEGFLKEKGIRFKPFDVKPTFDVFNGYLKEDLTTKVSIPTILIYKGAKKDRFTGAADITKALESLK